MLGFESAAHETGPLLELALQCCGDHGGTWDEPDQRSDDAVSTWREAFLRAPYLRDVFVAIGVLSETFETAITWDRFAQLHEAVLEKTGAAVREVCGAGSVTCRFTHVYPDGPALYFTVLAPVARGAELESWAAIKAAASEALIAGGATITHHHAVGRDHRPWYDRQRPDLFAQALRAAKRELDPAGALNPGVLLDLWNRIVRSGRNGSKTLQHGPRRGRPFGRQAWQQLEPARLLGDRGVHVGQRRVHVAGLRGAEPRPEAQFV